MPRLNRFVVGGVTACALAGTLLARPQQVQSIDGQVDRQFARWTSSTPGATPGCAVAAAENGKPVVSKAYGMADLEHDVRNTPETIFEAGSVSKQFTAAAMLLLARDGKLSIDDPVRKYIPELPEYATPLLIRHMLNHTSGLRDWGSVASIAGWPRTSRAYTHAHVLDIVSRQHSLNFPSGTRWSYSNTGYNLSAMLIARVSGMSFSDFTRQRIFEPLGMTRTSWRDDFTRVVKDRAIAYSDDRDGFHTDMPFENVHGNGGLLTTVGDLLKWNENFVAPKVGDQAFVTLQQTPGKFNDGQSHDYAFGLTAGSYKGLREVSHSGSTAGYRAFLTRYPDQHVSVAVLCNVSSGVAAQYAHAVADLLLGDRLKPVAAPTPRATPTPAELQAVAGLYRNTVLGTALTISSTAQGVRAGNTALVPESATRFVTAGGQSWIFDGRGGAKLTDRFGRVDTFARVEPAKPTPEELQALAGTYVSDEAEVQFVAAVDAGALVLKRRPDTTMRLTPVYKDAFSGGLGTIVFRRDAAGKVTAFSVSQDRVWDLRFIRK
jgi:CubicO group peptidase (beta-lactamase class C family)